MTVLAFFLLLLPLAAVTYLVYTLVFRFDHFVAAQERRAAVLVRHYRTLGVDGRA